MRPRRVLAREVVDECEVHGRVEQALRLVLPVHDREVRRHVAQQAHRDERTVHGRAALAARLQLAAEHDLVAVSRQAALVEERLGPGHLEDRLDRSPLLARADEVGRGAVAEHQAERVDQDRLAGAGFAREQGEAGAELQLQRGDERDVVDSQQFKH